MTDNADVTAAGVFRTRLFRTFLLVALAIVAFAGNSLLTRAALADGEMGADSFAAIRLGSGAVMLGLLALWRGQGVRPRRADASGVIALFVYMAGFSYAYNDLDAATGALLLFGAVQLTVFIVGVVRGEWPSALETIGAVVAFAGLMLLVGGGGQAQSLTAVILMTVAGVGWGAYTLLGRGAGDPLGRTARNFIGAAPLAVVLALLFGQLDGPGGGVLLAIASGVVTSGLGYALWYAVLPSLSRISAGVSQLLVPPVTALGGAALLAEPLTLRFALASAVILTGVGLTLVKPARRK